MGQGSNLRGGKMRATSWAAAFAVAGSIGASTAGDHVDGASSPGEPFPAVLTDNAVGDEAAIETGVTYTAEPAYSNPADSTGRRLFDRDQPWGPDWNATVGLNGRDQTVIFDFKAACRFSRFSFRMGRPQKPAHVDISVAGQPAGPWTEVGRLTPQEKADWVHLSPDRPASGRYVKAFFKLKTWGWYISEAKFWGVPANQPGPDVTMPLLSEGGQLVLVKDGRPAASIVLPADAPGPIVKHARFLQSTLRRMTGATLPLRDDSREWDGAIIDLTGTDTGEQEYGIRVDERQVTITGDAGYAVYDLLQRLGCGWFGPDPLYHVIPETNTLAVAPQERSESPAFAYRSVWNAFPETRAAWRLGGVPVHSSHNYSYIIPPEEYFEDHPEYFPLINGERQKDGQICLSNPEVRRITIEKARAWFDNDPGHLTYSLSANDTGDFCECDPCRALGPNPGSQTLGYANAVARELAQTHPGKMVCFLAYWYTFAAPPAGSKAEPNVMVMVVHQGDHAHALEDPGSKTNEGWRETFEGWAATGAKMAIYEWYIPGTSHEHWRRLPWVSIDTAYRNLRYWHRHGVRWITYESQASYEDGNGYPRRWPLYYLAARGLWDPNADPRHVLREACDKLYGPAGEAMFNYFHVLDEAVAQTQVEGSTWNLPPARLIFRDEVIEAAGAALDEALQAAKGHRDATRRVAGEVALWHESLETLSSLPPSDRNKVDARDYNGGVWYTDQAEATGRDLRDLVGIGAGEGTHVITPDGKQRLLADDETYPLVGGVGIATSAAP